MNSTKETESAPPPESSQNGVETRPAAVSETQVGEWTFFVISVATLLLALVFVISLRLAQALGTGPVVGVIGLVLLWSITRWAIRKWRRMADASAILIGLVLVVGSVGFYIGYRATSQWNRNETNLDRFAEDVRPDAYEVGNIPVTCRSVLNQHGRLDRSEFAGRWKVVFPNTIDDIRSNCSQTPVTVVFVHGYNNDLTDALESGNGLLHNIEACFDSDEGRRDRSPISFITFCWRGDYGPEAFPTAELAADASAESLEEFIRELRGIVPDRGRLVLIAHSLGARTTLEALRRLASDEDRTWLDCLVLVQAAIPCCSLYEGEYKKLRPGSVRESESARAPYDTHPFSGRYKDCIRASKHVVYTMGKDDILSKKYGPLKEPALLEVPPIWKALGLPHDTSGWRSYHPSLHAYDLSPGERVGVRIDRHSPIFGESDRRIVEFIWQQVETLLADQ